MSRRIVAIFAVVFAVVCGAAAFVWLHAGGQGKAVVHFSPDPPAAGTAPAAGNAMRAEKSGATAANGSAAAKMAAAAAEPGFVPVTGEGLEFSGSVANVNNVANFRLVVGARKEIGGAEAWHLQAFARTQNPLRLVFELDDEFDSYSAPKDFASVQYEMHLSERGQKVQSVQRMTTSGRMPRPPGTTGAVVLPGSRHPLGGMHYLRSADSPNTPS